MTKPPAFAASLRLISATLVAALSWSRADVVINEIHYDPTDEVANAEFVELHNTEDAAVDLGGWRLSGGVDFTIPEGTTLEGNGYLVVALDPEQSLFEGLAVVGPWEGRLNSEGERVVLRDASGTPVDEVDYAVRFPWPIASGGDGGSMELLNPTLDNDLGSSWRPSAGDMPTPGARNSVWVENAPPNIRQADHAPQQPLSTEETVITVKLTDDDGVQKVVLHYQIVEPGDYIPAFTAWSRSALESDPDRPRTKGSRYTESLFTGSWPTMEMIALDPDKSDEDPDNDDRYAVTLPPQPHRTLVRYYITAEDGLGNKVRGPLPDDPSMNFAYFVYDGVPDYLAEESVLGDGHHHSSELLTRLPVYHLLTSAEDWQSCLAYSASDQLSRANMDARRAYNWSGTIVYDGEVYDNINYRLRGGNGRYHLAGKRSMKFRFNRGRYFRVKNNRGKPYETTWRVLTTSKMFGNRTSGTFGTRNGPGNFGLIDTVNGQMWELFGVPAVRTHWFHFRVIDDAEEAPTQSGGDFYGLNLAMERVDVRFLESRDLPKGNLYKLTDLISSGKEQQRYQAPGAVLEAEDYLNIKNNLRSNKDEEWLRTYVNWDIWYRYTAVEEAIRHYDYWDTADKNMVYYFEPREGNPLGLYWQLPYDSDASWGPSWNEGIDIPQLAVAGKEPFQLELRNTIREFRDLVWQPDVIANLVEDAAAVIADFHPADRDRWANGNGTDGREDFGTLQSKVEDMQHFAFNQTGSTLSYPGGNVPVGGRALHLDNLAKDASIPEAPAITFTGMANHPVDGIAFESDEYRPTSIFASSELRQVEWRIGEVTDPEAPAYDPLEPRKYEITAVWTQTAEPEALTVSVPADVLKTGHTYRARVRHRDVTNRVSHWSEPYEFTTASPSSGATLQEHLVISELMYHPAPATEAELAAGFDESDFEFIELYNRGDEALDLTNVRFTKGVDFDFPEGTMLAAGAYGLVVAHPEAMSVRYGDGLPIIGQWETSFSLSNGGERVKLSFGAGNALVDFSYGDADPWPELADGAGHSLTLADTETVSTERYSESAQWRASAEINGTPGRGETQDPGEESGFETWLDSNDLTDPLAISDSHGMSHLAVYTMGLDLVASTPATGSGPAIVVAGDGELALELQRRVERDGVAIGFETSADLVAWETAAPEFLSAIPIDDEVERVSYRLLRDQTGLYWRVRFTVTN